jgi:hypothetical protein
MLCSLLNPWSVDAQLFLLAHTSQNNAIVVTMATNCNSHQQYSAVFQHLYHGLSLFLYKTFVIFGKDNQTCIHNLLPHLQDPTLNTGRICTDKCYTIYIHSGQATVNYSWNLSAYRPTTIIHHMYNTQTEVTVRYGAWQRPKHAPRQDACSFLIVHGSKKYFYNRN